MFLLELADQLIAERAVSHQTALQYRRCARRFGEFLQRPAAVDDLKESTINSWLVAEQKKGLTGTSVHNAKRGLTVLWNYAAELDLCGYYERRRLRKTRPDPIVVMARNSDDLQILIRAAESLTGQMKTGAPAKVMMLARVLVGFETGPPVCFAWRPAAQRSALTPAQRSAPPAGQCPMYRVRN